MRPVIPLWCCQIRPHSISFGPLPSGGCLSLYPRSHQSLASIVEKSNQKQAPVHTCIPWKLGSDSRSLLLVTSTHNPAVTPPSLSFTVILLPSVPSLLEIKLQLWALYLNQCYNDTFSFAQLTCNHKLPRFRTKTFPHTDKPAFSCDKGLIFL